MLFGDQPIDPQVLAKSLVQGVVPKFDKPDNWTTVVKDVLVKLGKDRNYYVAPDKSQDQPEYMLDLLWFRNSDSNDVLLAVESEWGGSKAVWHDFEKLMHVKAPLKAMILSTNRNSGKSSTLVEGIQKSYMEKFSQHVKDEEYLIIEFVHPRKTVHCHYYRVPSNGKVNKVQFKLLVTIPYPDV